MSVNAIGNHDATNEAYEAYYAHTQEVAAYNHDPGTTEHTQGGYPSYTSPQISAENSTSGDVPDHGINGTHFSALMAQYDIDRQISADKNFSRST
jgi:hypothetical protein